MTFRVALAILVCPNLAKKYKNYAKQLLQYFVLPSDVVLEYSTRTRVQLEYHFLSTCTRNPRYSAGTRRSMHSVLGQKKSRVHEYIWPLLKVINKMNI